MEKFKFRDGQKVEYNNGVMRGIGVIIGCSSVSLPVNGAIYIVKDSSQNIPSKEYPFECFTCAEVHLQSL